MHAKPDVTMSNNMFLSVTSRINSIVASWPNKRCLSQGISIYQVMMTLHFLNDVANDTESTQKSMITSIIANLKSEQTCKLINIIPVYQVYQARHLERNASRFNKRSRSLAW